MALNTTQQITKILETKKHALITTRANPSADSLASALAFCLIVKRIGMRATVAIDSKNFPIPNTYSFLPGFEEIQNKISPKKDILVEFDINNAKINGLTYKIKDQKLAIRIFQDKSDIILNSPKISRQEYPYDIIVIVGASDLSSLEGIYDDNTDFFYNTPIINIDHKSENEHFGEINLVELKSTATCEILFTLAESIDKRIIDQKLSTCLLTGIIHESRSFQSESITPKSLAIASELITLGADRQKIIQKLFYNKSVNSLRLWGRVLLNLKADQEFPLSWSCVGRKDFIETNTTEQNLMSIVYELVANAPESKSIALLYQKDESLKAIVNSQDPNIDLRKKLYPLKAHGSKRIIACDTQTKDEKEAIKKIKYFVFD